MYTASTQNNCITLKGDASRVTPKFVPIGRQATTAVHLQQPQVNHKKTCI